MREIAIIVHNVRSCENVGSILRSADGMGAKVILTGYTPHPEIQQDSRLPHEIKKTTRQISKTALGAEKTVDWSWQNNLESAVDGLKQQGYEVLALEQAKGSTPINDYLPQEKTAIIVGNEVDGLEQKEIRIVDRAVEIPMYGKKESFNVASSAAMALYHLRFVAR